MNRISTMSLAVALAVLTMAGCGDTPGTTAQPSTTTTAPPATPPAADKAAPAPAAPATPAPAPKHGCCQ